MAFVPVKIENFKASRKAIVDDVDLEKVAGFKWRMHPGGKAQTTIGWRKGEKKSCLLMHQLVIGKAPKGFEIDHINGNKLDNRRSNLRICSHEENMRNRKMNKNNKSGFKGVGFSKRENKWQVYIGVKKAKKFLGYFEELKDAAEAYKKASEYFHGDFAGPLTSRT